VKDVFLFFCVRALLLVLSLFVVGADLGAIIILAIRVQ
jgi:hypothetical protein